MQPRLALVSLAPSGFAADEVEDGARNALALCRELKMKGFAGQGGVISQLAQRRRLAEKANQSGLARTPSALVVARSCW